MKITIQYFEGCASWTIADARVRNVLRDLSRRDVEVEYQLIDSPEYAERVGFHGSPTILFDGRDPFADGTEPVGFMCRVYPTAEGRQGAPAESQLRDLLAGHID